MENFDNDSETSIPAETLHVDPKIKNYLSESAKWAKFLGIVGFILVGFLVLGAFFAGAFINFMNLNERNGSGENPLNSGAFSIGMAIYFLLIALLYFFPSLYLYQFGTKTRQALYNNEQPDFQMAFSRLKSFFKFFGILTAVMLVMYAVAMIMMLIFGAFFGKTGV